MENLSQASTHLLWEQMKSKYKIFSQFVSRSVVFSGSNWSWEYVLCLFPLNASFSQVLKCSSIPPLPSLKQFPKPTIRKEKRVVVVGRKWKQHHNVSRCVKHMLCCAGTQMCKCNAQFLSLSDFRKYLKWKWTVLWFVKLSPLLGPDSRRRSPCKLCQKKSSMSAPCHKAQSCCKHSLHNLLPVHLYF